MINPGADKEAVVALVTSTWDRLKRERLMKEDRWNECRPVSYTHLRAHETN